MPDVAIDWASVNWFYVAVLAVFVFVASLLGSLLSFSNRSMSAFLSAVLFAVIFVFWTYYPHGLPLPTGLTAREAATGAPAGMPSPPPEPAAPTKPRNPITDITPPSPRN